MNFPLFPFLQLLAWYKQNGRHDLPWRQYFHLSIKDITYHVWLSEILLQQTQVSRVIDFYNQIIATFPTIESLAMIDFETFFPYYQGLGYYSRARNLLKTAKIISEKYDGVFPNNQKILETLPGVGPYTAAAIRAFAYNEPILALDTNIQKIFARYYFGDKKTSLPKELLVSLENQLKEPHSHAELVSASRQSLRRKGRDPEINSGGQFTKISGRNVNAALMDFASVSQKYSDIDTLSYPLIGCQWYATKGEQEEITTKKSPVFPLKEAQILVILHENHKKYFSQVSGEYHPFFLPTAKNKDIRHFIKDFFESKYGITLSVRPVHDKFVKKSIPYIVCNAQVQAGLCPFFVFTKNDKNEFWKKFLKK